MIYLAVIAAINAGLAAYLAYENRKLTYIAISRHVGDVARLQDLGKQKKSVDEERQEKAYHPWRTPNEGVGP